MFITGHIGYVIVFLENGKQRKEFMRDYQNS